MLYIAQRSFHPNLQGIECRIPRARRIFVRRQCFHIFVRKLEIVHIGVLFDTGRCHRFGEGDETLRSIHFLVSFFFNLVPWYTLEV